MPSLPPRIAASKSKNLSPKLKAKKLLLALALLASAGIILGSGPVRSILANPLNALSSRLCITECPSNTPQSPTPALLNRPDLLTLIGNDFEPDKLSVLVEKSAYTLTVRYNNQPIRSYPIVLGSAPIGDKRMEGDRKTPEGLYRVQALYPHPNWSKFIWLDYPTEQDRREHEQAKHSGELPATATVGSEIGIHGVPQGADALIDNRTNWTWGCIALKNSDINEIYEVMRPGTVIEIIP
jgi:hypothetical protein